MKFKIYSVNVHCFDKLIKLAQSTGQKKSIVNELKMHDIVGWCFEPSQPHGIEKC